jgi:hypothetical protein
VRGASAINALLRDFTDAKLRVLAVWEPVLITDISPPTTTVLGLLGDPRASQYWDPGRAVSGDIVGAVNAHPARYGMDERLPPDFIAWDVVAVFASDARWDHELPPPAYYGGPVEDVIEEARRSLIDQLAVPAGGPVR